MGLHADNGNLCLREFSKSLTNMAYSCYIIFATKTHQNVVFHVEENFTLLSLCNAKQEQWCRSAAVHSNLLLLYIQICCCCTFRSGTVHPPLPWYSYVKYEEYELARVCIDNMPAEYHSHLENENIIKFVQLFQRHKR
jgi:hypothetical protein